jgi:protein-serine/threonine kinase
LIDKDGHIKLSDFGLSTGFHKTHETNYYTQGTNLSKAPSIKRNIDLSMSRKDRIATWKRNRRDLVFALVAIV